MNKKTSKVSNQRIKTAQDLFKALSSDYYFDMHIPNFRVIRDKFDIEKKILNTKQIYCKYHPEFDIKSFDKFPIHFLKDIVKDDNIIYFDDTLILKELYKIMQLIDTTNNIIKYITTNNYTRHIQANKNITSQMNIHRNFLLPSTSVIRYRGEHRLNWHFLNNFRKEKKITKFFLQAMSLMDIEKIGMFYNEDKEIIEQILHFYEKRLIQKTTPNAVLKSLAILLHYEFKHYLNIGDDDSKMFIVDIMSNIYNTKVDDDGFNRKIHISSTIAFTPIFGAKKDQHFIDREKQIIKNLLIKDMRQQNPKIKIDYETIDIFLNEHLETQHLEYLKKYPNELLKINEKYSHLKPLN